MAVCMYRKQMHYRYDPQWSEWVRLCATSDWCSEGIREIDSTAPRVATCASVHAASTRLTSGGNRGSDELPGRHMIDSAMSFPGVAGTQANMSCRMAVGYNTHEESPGEPRRGNCSAVVTPWASRGTWDQQLPLDTVMNTGEEFHLTPNELTT